MTPLDAMKLLLKADADKPLSIMIIGDGMTDIYVHGRIDTCQEGCTKFTKDPNTPDVTVPGGAANVSRTLKNWNVNRETPYGSVGGPIKTRFMVNGRCVFRYDDDKVSINLNYVRGRALDTILQGRVQGVLLSDYNKGTLTKEFITKVVHACSYWNIPCVADAKQPPDVYRGCTIKANGEWGVRHLSNLSIGSVINTTYIETHGHQYPSLWGGKAWVPTRVPDVPDVECVNHVGAGDCFAAHLTLALTYGIDMPNAVAIAHAAGRVYVQRQYNTPPVPKAIRDDLAGWE